MSARTRTLAIGGAIAAVIALSAGVGAVAAGQIGSAQIKDGGVYSPDIHDDAVRSVDLRDGGVHGNDLAAGQKAGRLQGLESDGPYPGRPDSENNLQGDQGAQSTDKWAGDAGATLQVSWVQCAPGKYAIGGGFSRADEGVAAFRDLQVVTSSPAQIDGGELVYDPISGDDAGSFRPNGWLVEGFNNGATDLIVRPHVVCAKITS